MRKKHMWYTYVRNIVALRVCTLVLSLTLVHTQEGYSTWFVYLYVCVSLFGQFFCHKTPQKGHYKNQRFIAKIFKRHFCFVPQLQLFRVPKVGHFVMSGEHTQRATWSSGDTSSGRWEAICIGERYVVKSLTGLHEIIDLQCTSQAFSVAGPVLSYPYSFIRWEVGFKCIPHNTH